MNELTLKEAQRIFRLDEETDCMASSPTTDRYCMEPQDQSQEMEITLIRRTKSIAEDPAAGQRKRDRESGRLKAQEHAPEMLMMIVGIARDSGEDTKNRFAAAKYVCDRAWGTPKAEQNEDPAITNKTMLDILASVSRECFEAEEAARKQIATQSRLAEPRQNPIIEASYVEVPNDEYARTDD